MNDDTIRAQVVQYSQQAYIRGLVGGTGGNLSARLSDGKMLITPSGISLANTTLENLVAVDLQTLDWHASGEAKPSKEFMFHAAILRRRSDVGAILHCHSAYATAYAVNKRDIPMVTDAAFKQPPMPRVPFAPSGSERLRDNVAEAIERHPGCKVLLLEEHGIIALGCNVIAAYDTADLTEELARIAYLAGRLAEANHG
jgi:ribulose-5-phosphate 4-epimerase/fuculose-1-phosphate aldolase